MRNNNPMLTLRSFPTAILHIDGDAFFTSVEQAVNPSLKGQPIITGKERGIISCSSYEARAMGIKRGISLSEAKRICPNVKILTSDYETYSLFSKRMFAIVREYTPSVEEYSIDECFADITGMRRLLGMSYEDIARAIQKDIHEKLGITVSVGLSLTKGLAKLCSDFRKPSGFTAVRGKHIHRLLPRVPVSDVWGIGPNSASLLAKYGIRSAYDFVCMDEKMVKRLLKKPGVEIWNELRGDIVYDINTEEKKTYASISKSKTFSNPSADRDFIYAKLIRNMESAFIKLRRYNLRTRKISCILRSQNFSESGLSAELTRGTGSTIEAARVVKEIFDQLYKSGELYRCTSIVLDKIESDEAMQYELFMDNLDIERMAKISKVTDGVNEQFGKHHISLGTGLYLQKESHTGRGEKAWRKTSLLPGESSRKRINLPRMNLNI